MILEELQLLHQVKDRREVYSQWSPCRSPSPSVSCPSSARPSLMAELLYLEMPGAFPCYLSQETSWNPVIILLWDFPTPEVFSDPLLVHTSQILGIETERVCLTLTFLRENKALSLGWFLALLHLLQSDLNLMMSTDSAHSGSRCSHGQTDTDPFSQGAWVLEERYTFILGTQWMSVEWEKLWCTGMIQIKGKEWSIKLWSINKML